MKSPAVLLLLAASGVAACAVAPEGAPGEGEKLGQVSSAIIGGITAFGHPEAALVDMLQNGQQFAACSGVVIAPQVVLTAGHCIAGASDWSVTTPYAQGQTVHGSNGAVYDYLPEAPSETVDPDFHDVGLVFLDTPIQLDQYPVVAAQPLPFGASVVNIGRIQNGNFSMTDLFVGPEVMVSDGTPYGYPYDYAATDVIESGDSGGPVETPDGTIVVAINSGGGGGDIEVLARVDLVYGWIQQQVQANGGGGNDAGITPDYASTDAGAGNGYGYGVESDDAGNGATQGASGPGGPSGLSAGDYGCSSAPGSASSPAGLLLLGVMLALGTRRRRRREP